MTKVSQIAEHIDKKSYAFSVYMTKPEFKELAQHAYKVEDTYAFIMDLITESGAEEIQIQPARKNGSTFKHGVAKTVTISLTNDTPKYNTPMENNGLNGVLGLGFSDAVDLRVLRTKDEARTSEISILNKKIEELEKEKSILEIENRKLLSDKATADREKELDLKLAKLETRSSLDRLLENPALVGQIITAIKPVAQTALTGAEQIRGGNIPPKVKYVLDYLLKENTNESVRDFYYLITKSQLGPLSKQVSGDMVEVLKKYELIN